MVGLCVAERRHRARCRLPLAASTAVLTLTCGLLLGALLYVRSPLVLYPPAAAVRTVPRRFSPSVWSLSPTSISWLSLFALIPTQFWFLSPRGAIPWGLFGASLSRWA